MDSMPPKNTKKTAETPESAADASLKSWLEKHNARYVRSMPTEKTSRVDVYLVAAQVVMIERYEMGGWSIYTTSPHNNIEAALADAERSLGLA